jgi:hypothetical protein
MYGGATNSNLQFFGVVYSAINKKFFFAFLLLEHESGLSFINL